MHRTPSPVALALVALALAAALAGCTPSAAERHANSQAEYERAYNQEQGDKAAADYYRSVERQREQETRRIVREELDRRERAAPPPAYHPPLPPKGLLP